MGIYKHTYFGIYLEIKPKIVQTNNWVKVNPGTKEVFSIHLNFDPHSGRPLIKENRPKSELSFFSFYSEDITQFGFSEDVFFAPAYTQDVSKLGTWILNDENLGHDTNSLTNYEIASGDIERKINFFKTKYAQCLALISKSGYEYQVKFGIVNYEH